MYMESAISEVKNTTDKGSQRTQTAHKKTKYKEKDPFEELLDCLNL